MSNQTIYQTNNATVGGLSDELTDQQILDEFEHFLPLFIYLLYAAGTNWGNSPLGPGGTPTVSVPTRVFIDPNPSVASFLLSSDLTPNTNEVHAPSLALYKNIFRYLCETDGNGNPDFLTHSDTIGKKVETNFNPAAPPVFSSNGYLMEGAMLLALFVIRIQLSTPFSTTTLISRYQDPNPRNPSSPGPFDRTNEVIYKRLQKLYNDASTTGSISGTNLDDLLNLDISKIDHIKKLENIYIGTAAKSTTTYNKLRSILQEAQHIISDEARKRAYRYLRLLGWKHPDPEYHLLVVGEGSGTKGILNIGSAGIGMFQYNYQADEHVSGASQAEHIFTKGLNNQILSLRDKSLVHLALFGVDSSDVNAAGAAIFERSLGGNVSRYAVKTNSTAFNKLERKGTLNYTSDLDAPYSVIAGSATYNWYNTTTGTISPCTNTLIGGWNDTLNDMTLFDPEGSFRVYLRKASGSVGAEELFLIVAACGGELEMNLELEDLYDEDRFELSNADREALIDNNPDRSNFIDFMINQIVREKAEIEIEELKGGFVGRTKNPVPGPGVSKIESNPLYQFDLGDPNHDPAGGSHETSASGDPSHLYSFGKIAFENNHSPFIKNKFKISIESYCSSEWSRLDRRFHFDIRNWGHSLTIYGSSVAPSTTGPDGLNQHTIFGQDPLTNAKISAGQPQNPTGAIDLPSYNDVLTKLRSIGLLEALFISTRVKYNALSCADPDLICDVLQPLLDSISLSTHTPTPTTITYEDYTRFKWYVIETEGNWLPHSNGSGGYNIAAGNNPADYSTFTDM
jgi:hypothetical protein